MSNESKRHIHLSLDHIPEVREPMPVMKLGAPVMAPEKLIRDIVRVIAPEAEFKEMASGARHAYHKNRLVAFVNPKSGESNVIPTLGMLKPGIKLSEQARAVAVKIARESALFPKDGTEAVALEPIPLLGAKYRIGEKATNPSEYISYVRFQRRVNGVPVFGPGTKATIGVAADGSVCALILRWRKAIPSDEKMVARPREEIYKAIVEQLKQKAIGSDIRVDKVMICYYDGGENYLQPVYRYDATIKRHTSNQKVRRAANYHVQGYVPIGTELEPIVHKQKPIQNPPMLAKSKVEKKSPPVDDPTVGRYIIQHDIDDWWKRSWDFIDGLRLAEIFFGGIQFTDSQYYWAEDYQYLSDKNDFVNNVNIALSESHGNWWKICMDVNPWKCIDDIRSIGDTGGYGSGAGGVLAYWIIHSCEVIPTIEDTPNSFDHWWNVFNGLRAVVGYRTEMIIEDGVEGPFGFQIGLGAAVVPTWLNVVISSDSYQSTPMYCDGNRHICEPKGLASAIVVDGHHDDTVLDIGPLDKATCLWEWRFPNVGDCHPCGWHPRDVTGEAGGLAVAGSALTSTLLDGNPRVYYVGRYNHVYELAWSRDDDHWYLRDVTEDAGGQPANEFAESAALTSTLLDGNPRVYHVGNDNHVYELAWSRDDDHWYQRDVTGDAGGQPAMAGSALTSTLLDGNPRVYHVGNDNHVYELAWSRDDDHWYQRDVTGDAGGQPAMAGSALTSTLLDGNPRVYYVGNDNHVYELAWSRDDDHWYLRDVTGEAGGLAVAGSALTSTLLDGNPRVYYVGRYNHVYELAWSRDDDHWYLRDVTEDAGGQPANEFAESAALTSTLLDGNPRVYHVGNDNHVYELAWSRDDDHWYQRDVTGDAGGQPAMAGSALTSTLLDGNPRVYYVGSDNHVYELAWLGEVCP